MKSLFIIPHPQINIYCIIVKIILTFTIIIEELFSSLAIADTTDFEKHLNKYNVIHLDITRFASKTSDIKGMIARIEKIVK